MSLVDAIILVCGSILGLVLVIMFAHEWIDDSKIKHRLRDAGVDEEEIKGLFRARATSRSRAH